MNEDPRNAFATAESWSVAYEDEVYSDARQIDGDWYYRLSLAEGVHQFPAQDRVIPICKNLTSTRKRSVQTSAD